MLTELPYWLDDVALLLLRVVIAIVFFSSGKSHLANPKERGAQIELPVSVTIALGIVEVLGAFLLASGPFIRVGSVLLGLVMLGAMYMKIFRWKTGFYEDKGYGWHYDLLLFCGILVIFTSKGGSLVLW